MRFKFIIVGYVILLLLCSAALAACFSSESVNWKLLSPDNPGKSLLHNSSSDCGPKFKETNWKARGPFESITCPMKGEGCGEMMSNCKMQANCSRINKENCSTKFTPKSGCTCRK